MRRYLLFLLILAMFAGCDTNKPLPPISEKSVITGIALPVKLGVSQTEIPLSDFYPDPSKIEKLSITGLDPDSYSVQDDVLIIEADDNMDAMMSIELMADGITENIPIIRSDMQAVEISFESKGVPYKSVSVRGEFNGWTAGRDNLELENGIWKTTLMISPGSYQYLLVVNGRDMLHPDNPQTIRNNNGGYNSLLTVGTDLADNIPQIFTISLNENNFTVGYKNDIIGLLPFWQNVLLPTEYYEIGSDGVIEIIIPENASKLKRSFIRLWAWNESGISNDLLIPLEDGKVIDDAGKLDRNDKHSMILYNAFIDRFNDADPGNNRPLNIAEVLPRADYHGGDIKGVTEKIRDGYFERLGVNTIWISPIVKNPEGAFGYWPEPASKFSGYHGYWPISFTLIDDRYGNEDELHELVSVAHENGMNVLLDFVANHVHQEHPVYIEHPEWATELYLPDGTLNTERWDEHRLTTWFDVFLPTLDLSKPEVYEMLSDSAVYWIKKYDLDGFRHDATKHIPEVFWRSLTKKLKDQIVIGEDRPIYQMGETYGGPQLISSYIGSGMLDAQFDFNVYDDALSVIIIPDQHFSRLNESLEESLKYYGSHNLMGYITGNQDRGRFTSYAGASLLFKEDAKVAGWTREITVGDKRGYLSTALLFAFNMTIPGLPVIYYGDEIGMPGGNDPDSRRMMRFEELSEEELALFDKVRKLAHFRRTSMPLIYGDFEALLVDDLTYGYCRSYFDQIVIVAMNKSSKPKSITFDVPERFAGMTLMSNFNTSAPELRAGKMSFTLGPRSFDIITNQR